MSVFFFDTETTGFPKNIPFEDPSQPMMVEIAGRLDDDGGNLQGMFSQLVSIGDFPIDDGALAVHKISNSLSNKYGLTLQLALNLFHSFSSRADVLVAHNIEFDMKIMKIAYTRLNKLDRFTSDIQTKTQFCTLQASTELCKLPGRNGYKWPKLDEAYKLLVDPGGFETKYGAAHRAMADMLACRELFYSLKKPKENAQLS